MSLFANDEPRFGEGTLKSSNSRLLTQSTPRKVLNIREAGVVPSPSFQHGPITEIYDYPTSWVCNWRPDQLVMRCASTVVC